MQPSDFVSVYCEIAELVGVENAVKIYEHFRGQQMAFPTRIYSIQYVEKYVKEHYDGREANFKNAIEHSEMVMKLIDAINEKQYDATDVWVGSNETQINNGDNLIQTLTYKKYGYPDLENYQIDILTDYLVSKLTLKFRKVSFDWLELNAAPDGMRTSW